MCVLIHETLTPLTWSADRGLQLWQQSWALRNSSDPPSTVLMDLRKRPFIAKTDHDLKTLLSNTELKRWRELKRANDREDYLARTALLRTLLGQMLHRKASAIEFRTGIHGKPELIGNQRVQFNISHSGAWLLMAFHPNQQVGVDVQKIDDTLNWRPIAERCIASSITETILEQPEWHQQEYFIKYWCELEALLKCRGQGLSGLNRDDPSARAKEERLWTVRVQKGYRAAAAQSPNRFSTQS
ncbi:MAG: hypothetical protein CMJ28_04085 [Phycisphaerae bacterium]|nr:hypothetical protein [Phycisphaerae bacterium]